LSQDQFKLIRWYFLVGRAFCGTNTSFASICNDTNESFGSSTNDFDWNSFSTPNFYHQTGVGTLTNRPSLLESVLGDKGYFCLICYCFVTSGRSRWHSLGNCLGFHSECNSSQNFTTLHCLRQK